MSNLPWPTHEPSQKPEASQSAAKDSDIRFTSTTEAEAARGVADLLQRLAVWIRRFVVVTPHQATTIALWAMHTHVIEHLEHTPYLQVTSAMKESGKTRLLEVLEPVVARPWLTGRVSAAALVRKVDSNCATLLLDETDAAFNSDKEYAEALRGILNTGYKASGTASLCVGQGTKIEVRDFKTFSAKAFAGIGELPGTVASRSIRIVLERRAMDDAVEKFRGRDGREQAASLGHELQKWGTLAGEIVGGMRPDIPDAISDRQQDVWEPLLAIADLAGGPWPGRARQAALNLSGTLEDNDTLIELLTDIHGIIKDFDSAIIPTKTILDILVSQDDRPWATWSRGKPLTPHKLARYLKTIGVHVVRMSANNGYRVDALVSVIARYLRIKAPVVQNTNKTGAESTFSKVHTDPAVGASECAETPIKPGVNGGMELQGGEMRDRGLLYGFDEVDL